MRRLFRLAQRVPYLSRTLRVAEKIPEAVRLAMDPDLSETYYPGEERKGKLRRVTDHVTYLLRHRELDDHYFQYGLDLEGRRSDSVIPYPEFRRLRDGRNAAPAREGYNYVCLLRDKFIFAQFAESLGYPTPRNVAFLRKDSVEWLSPRHVVSLDALLETDLDGFCKPFAGIKGRGAFALRVQGGQFLINEASATLDDLRVRLTERFLLQERMIQHPDLARLHPASVNAIRVITVLERGHARLFSTHLRVGAHGEPTNSVGVGGGFAINIDTKTGKLSGRGLTRNEFAGQHPDTGVVFDGYLVPFFQEAVALACRFHEDIRYIHSIGWDVAIAPEGPVFIEGNDNWGGAITMALEPDFKDRFLTLYR